MSKQVNFEDNVFILMTRIRMIKDCITLDADPELFLEKILDDIYFTESILKILLKYLEENSRLFDRDELLVHYSEAEWQFSRILKDFLDHDGNISIQEIPVIKEKIEALGQKSFERQKLALNMSPDGKTIPGSPIVSSDELTELLKAL